MSDNPSFNHFVEVKAKAEVKRAGCMVHGAGCMVQFHLIMNIKIDYIAI